MQKLIGVKVDNGHIDMSEYNVNKNLALLIPIVYGSYRKNINSIIVGTLDETSSALNPSKDTFEGVNLLTGETDEEIHEDMIAQFKIIVSALTYMVDSKSWKDGLFYDDDKAEIAVRLNQAMSYV